jgi:hypothetical protein
MTENKRFSILPGDLIWGGILFALGTLLLTNQGLDLYTQLTGSHPFAAGFFKFSLLASLGELLSMRIASGKWVKNPGGILKALLWGLTGVAITFMFTFYHSAVLFLQQNHSLPAGDIVLATAFFTSVLMNLTFGPAFMIAHKMADVVIEKYAHTGQIDFAWGLKSVDWPVYLSVVIRSIILFWIPAHTLVFLMPLNFRVLAAASLSIVLGIILSVGQRSDQ